MGRKLIILSSSERRNSALGLLPALERYDGLYFRLIRKYLNNRKLRQTDVAIVSERGIILGTDCIPYWEPFQRKTRGQLALPKSTIARDRMKNLKRLEKLLSRQYDEIFINVGKGFYQLIEGFEKLATTKITYAKGRGLGPKATSMKDWILSSPD
jgi:hypothetical protein